MKSQPHQIRHRSARTGFTLVEVLVVISIIIVLAVLSVAGFSRMRAAAHKATGVRNIAQLQIANISYAGDHNGFYAPVYGFDDQGVTYTSWAGNKDFISMLIGDKADEEIKEIDAKLGPRMPLSLLDPAAVRAGKSEYDRMPASYGYNYEGSLGGWGAPGASSIPLAVSQVRSPERSAAFFTATDFIAKYAGRFTWKNAAAVEGYTKDGKIAYRHNNKALVAYYDGHVGEVSQADIRKIDQQGGVANVFWNARK
jgi:prepilin-type processing-associated H-X9-DG protein